MGKFGQFRTIREAILSVLGDGQPHSVADLTRRTGSSDPRGHIRTLRNSGIRIDDDWEQTPSGSRFKKYFLK